MPKLNDDLSFFPNKRNSISCYSDLFKNILFCRMWCKRKYFSALKKLISTKILPLYVPFEEYTKYYIAIIQGPAMGEEK